jgi:CheY-like chemotaxis protein/HPt (histidine-containing phosphotransfer) domain-containing protein
MLFKAPDAKILIVDDSAINLEIAAGLLATFEIQCRTALSGYEALDMVEKEHFDLILMDHMMPGMDGIDTAKTIRALVPSAKNTPIIALTANVVEGSREMYLRAGMVGLVPKPIDVKVLTDMLDKWLPSGKKIEVSDGGEKQVTDKNRVPLFDCLDCDKALELLGSEQVFKNIVSDYYKRGKEAQKAIENAKNLGILDEYARLAHTLKSSSRQIGAYELGDLAEKLEQAGKASDTATIGEYHTKTMKMFEELLQNLSKYFM